MIKRSNKIKGFTLIELLVVIAIIGILSSVVLASLSGARESAKATRMASDLKQIETGMIMWMQAEGRTEWPHESNFGTISSEVENGELGNYLNTAPEPLLGSNNVYQYDNDGDKFTCGSGVTAGVNIHAQGIDQEVAKQMDKAIDGGVDFDCGKFKWRDHNGGQLLFSPSADGGF